MLQLLQRLSYKIYHQGSWRQKHDPLPRHTHFWRNQYAGFVEVLFSLLHFPANFNTVTLLDSLRTNAKESELAQIIHPNQTLLQAIPKPWDLCNAYHRPIYLSHQPLRTKVRQIRNNGPHKFCFESYTQIDPSHRRGKLDTGSNHWMRQERQELSVSHVALRESGGP